MKNKIAVYTAVFDGYDIVQPPLVIPDDIDFYCFTNNSNGVQAPWKIIDYKIASNDNPKVASARLKILGHDLLSMYQYTVWVDGNIIIRGDIEELVTRLMSQSLISVNKHKSRCCVYEEAQVCIKQKKANPETTVNQMRRYCFEGYPKNYGLAETTVLIRSVKSETIKNTMEIWWNEFSRGGYRDQFSFDYSLWRAGIQFAEIGHDYFGKSGFFFKLPHVPSRLRGRFVFFWNLIARFACSNKLHHVIFTKLLLSLLSRMSRL